MADQKRKVMDCRTQKGSNCTLTISGSEAEVIDAGVQHVVAKHGFKNDEQTKYQVRGMLKEEALAR